MFNFVLLGEQRCSTDNSENSPKLRLHIIAGKAKFASGINVLAGVF